MADWATRHPAGPLVALIPAYNEERFIGSLVLAAQPHVDQVVVVDDGSDDRTAEIAERAGGTVIRHELNRGKAAAVNTAFGYLRRLSPSAVVILDGRKPHAMLVELFTEHGAGTLICA